MMNKISPQDSGKRTEDECEEKTEKTRFYVRLVFFIYVTGKVLNPGILQNT
jgi:hypothetical protein